MWSLNERDKSGESSSEQAHPALHQAVLELKMGRVAAACRVAQWLSRIHSIFWKASVFCPIPTHSLMRTSRRPVKAE
jgi:hypothetical protein